MPFGTPLKGNLVLQWSPCQSRHICLIRHLEALLEGILVLHVSYVTFLIRPCGVLQIVLLAPHVSHGTFFNQALWGTTKRSFGAPHQSCHIFRCASISSTSWLPYSTDFIFVFVSWVGGGDPSQGCTKMFEASLWLRKASLVQFLFKISVSCT